MFRRSVLMSACAVAASLLAITGCKTELDAAAPAQATAAVQSGPVKSGPLIIEPGAGFSPVYSLINGAK